MSDRLLQTGRATACLLAVLSMGVGCFGGYTARLYFHNLTTNESGAGAVLASPGDQVAIKYSFHGDGGEYDKWGILQMTLCIDGKSCLPCDPDGMTWYNQVNNALVPPGNFLTKIFWQCDWGPMYDWAIDPSGDSGGDLVCNEGLYALIGVNGSKPQADDFDATLFTWTIPQGAQDGETLDWMFDGRVTGTGLSTRILDANSVTVDVTDNYLLVTGAGPPPEWVENPSSGHLYAATTLASWTQARKQAVLAGGMLATIEDQDEHDWLVSTFGDTEDFHIGLRDVLPGTGKWRWETGEPFTYANWGPDQPGDTTTDWAVDLDGASAGQWKNVPDAHIARGIIERVPPMVERWEIPSDGTIVTSDPLDPGKEYVVEVSGVWSYDGWRRADAEFWQDASGQWHEENGEGALDLLVNGERVDWLGTEDGVVFTAHTYSPSHVYRLVVTGEDLPLAFQIDDPYGTIDNYGSLQVRIYSPVPGLGPQPDAPWPLMEADQQTTGYLPWAIGPTAFGVAWSLPNVGRPLVVSAEGDIYCAHGSTLQRVSSSGQLLDEVTPGTADITGAAIAVDGVVYAVSGNESVTAYSEDLGTVVWQEPGGGYCGLMLDDDGNLYYGGWYGDGNVYSRAYDGTFRWSLDLGSNLRRGISMGPDGNLYFSSLNSTLVFIVSHDGALLDTWDTMRHGPLPPVFGPNGEMYLIPDDGFLQCFHSDFTLNWEEIIDGGYGAPSVLPNGRVIAAGFWNTSLFSFDPDGTLLWEVPEASMCDERVRTDALGTVSNVNWSGDLWAVDFLGNTLFWETSACTYLPYSHVMGAQGMMYASFDDVLYAVGPGTPALQEVFLTVDNAYETEAETVTLSARLALGRNAGGIRNATIHFLVDDEEVDTAVTDWCGIAKCQVPAPALPGAHEVKAVYDGDAALWNAEAVGTLWTGTPLSVVSGLAVLGLWEASCECITIEFVLYDGDVEVWRGEAHLDADCRYTLHVPFVGTYSLCAKPTHWLSRLVTDVTLDPDVPAEVNFISPRSFINGDCNGDDCVDLLDLNGVLTDFGSLDAPCDLNGDGIVDLVDLNIVLVDFGRCGECRP